MERLEIDLMEKMIHELKLSERATKFICYQVNLKEYSILNF